MGSSDILSSGRGPTVIGTLVAVLVLAGFGGLFVVFDKDMEKAGTKKIEAVVRDLGLEIEGKEKQLASYKKLVEEGELLKEQAKTMSDLESALQKGKPQIEELKVGITEAGNAIVASEKAADEYHELYRAQIWEEAVGRNLGDVKGVKSGKLFTGAVITKVDHTGIKVTDSTGPKKILLEDVPPALVAEFQLSQEKADDFNEKEGIAVGIHIDNAELAELAQRVQAKAATIKELEGKADKADGAARAATTNISEYDRAISRLQSQIRAEKGKSLSKAPQMEKELSELKARAATNRDSVETHRQTARDARNSLAQAKTDLRKLTDDFKAKQKEIADKATVNPAPANGQ